jgi:hypothetical protein
MLRHWPGLFYVVTPTNKLNSNVAFFKPRKLDLAKSLTSFLTTKNCGTPIPAEYMDRFKDKFGDAACSAPGGLT